MEKAARSSTVLLSLAALYLVWGSTYLANRIGLESIPPLFMGGVRFCVAGGLLYGWLRLSGALRPTPKQWAGAALSAIFLLVLGNGLLVIGQQWVSSGVTAVVVSTMPLWVAILGGLVSLRGGKSRSEKQANRATPLEWLGLLVGFSGAMLLHAGGGLSVRHAGSVVVLLAPVCWAVGALLSRVLALPEGPLAQASQMLVAGPIMLVASPLAGERLASIPSARSLLALAYLVVFGSIVGFSAFGYLMRKTRPAIATSYAYVNPIVAITLGVLLGGEHAGPATWLSSLVVIAGVLLLHVGQSKKAAIAHKLSRAPSS